MRFKGEHTEKVTLKQRTEERNEYGELIESWDSNDVTVYAEFFERHGKEGESDGQIMVIQDVRCKVRYRPALDPNQGNRPERDHRIVRGSTTYDIQSVVQEGRRQAQLLILQR